MDKVIAVCPSCKKEDGFKTTITGKYLCDCGTFFHYTELDYKIEGEEITTKEVTIGMHGSITIDGKFAGFPFTKGDSIGE